MIRQGLWATLALAANADAFMIPSTMSLPHIKGNGLEALKNFNLADKLSGAGHVVANERIVKLGCPGCSFEGPKDAASDNAMVNPTHCDGYEPCVVHID